MKSLHRLYLRAAFGSREKQDLIVALKELARYCNEPEISRQPTSDLHEAMKQYTYWPELKLLNRISGGVKRLAKLEREKEPEPLWKAFRLLDKRIPSLRLVSRVDGIVKRAKERINDMGESGLMKIRRDARTANPKARALLRDIALIKPDEKRAKYIDWGSHHLLLSELSNQGVELACGATTASSEVRCYARVLELMLDDDRRQPLRKKCQPLLAWLCDIGHPKAISFGAFSENTVSIALIYGRIEAGKKRRRELELTRERVKRHRARKDSLPE